MGRGVPPLAKQAKNLELKLLFLCCWKTAFTGQSYKQSMAVNYYAIFGLAETLTIPNWSFMLVLTENVFHRWGLTPVTT